MDMDEQTQEIYTHLEFQPRPGTRAAAARVIVAAQDYIKPDDLGVGMSLATPKLGALRLALIEFEQVVNPSQPVEEMG